MICHLLLSACKLVLHTLQGGVELVVELLVEFLDLGHVHGVIGEVTALRYTHLALLNLRCSALLDLLFFRALLSLDHLLMNLLVKPFHFFQLGHSSSLLLDSLPPHFFPFTSESLLLFFLFLLLGKSLSLPSPLGLFHLHLRHRRQVFLFSFLEVYLVCVLPCPLVGRLTLDLSTVNAIDLRRHSRHG